MSKKKRIAHSCDFFLQIFLSQRDPVTPPSMGQHAVVVWCGGGAVLLFPPQYAFFSHTHQYAIDFWGQRIVVVKRKAAFFVFFYASVCFFSTLENLHNNNNSLFIFYLKLFSFWAWQVF